MLVVHHSDAKSVFVSWDAYIAPKSKVGKPGALFDSNRPETLRNIPEYEGDERVGEPNGRELLVGKMYPSIAHGLHEGLLGMCVGSKAKVTVPDNHAWGPEGRPAESRHFQTIKGAIAVPKYADVQYDIEIKRIRDVFKEMDSDKSGEVTFEEMIDGIQTSHNTTLKKKGLKKFKKMFKHGDQKIEQKPFGNQNGALDREEFK
jgi:hypothetical protein